MTTKDYRLIAEVVAQLPHPYRDYTCARFARRLREDNPRFDGDLFFTACGVSGAKTPDTRERISDHHAE